MRLESRSLDVVSRSWLFRSNGSRRHRHEFKSWHRPAFEFHGFCEHQFRSDPEAVVAVERPIDDQFFERLTVPCHPDDFVFFALVMPVATNLEWGHGWKIRLLVHR